MPKDFTAPSQNWNVQDQFNQSKQINQENNNTLDLYKKKTENIKFIQSSLDELENNGQDVSSLRKKLDEKLSNSELSFGEKLGVVGRNNGRDIGNTLSKYFLGQKQGLSYSDKLDEAKQKREEVINPISTMATETLVDPTLLMPLGWASKGSKAVRMAKDFGKGAGFSSGMYTLTEGGKDNFKVEDALLAGAFGGAFNSLAGRFVNRKYVDNVPSQDVTNAYNITRRILDDGGTPFTKDAKLQDFINKYKNPNATSSVAQRIANETVQESVVKPKDSDDIAKKINDTYFKDANNTNVVQPEVQVRSDMPKVDNTTSPIEKKDYSPYIFENNSKPISKLPDTLPLNNKEEMKSIIQYAKDNDAVDEFISKLPQNARVDEVQKFFDNLKPTQIKEDGIIPVTTNKKEPIKNYDIPSLQEFEGLTKATGNNTANVLSLSTPTSTSGVRNAIERYVNGTASQRDIEILDAVENFMKYEGDNFRQKVGVSKPDTSMKIDDAIRNDIDYKTADANGAIPFSNGTQTFGGASVGGLESEFNQRDYNNDGKHDYKDNVYGVIVGALGINAAKKLFPKAFKDGNIDKNTNGMFVGKSPTDTIRVENQGKYKIPLSQEVQDLSKIKTNELNFKEFNNPNAKHQEQKITNSAELKRVIDKALGKPTVFSDGTSQNTRLISSNINGKDNIVVADKQSGNVVSSFATSKPTYISKVIEKDSGVPPTTHSSHQGTTVSSKDAHNTVPSLIDKSISNNIPKSQDIKLNASPTIGGGLAGGVIGFNNDLDGDGKITYKDIAIGALGGAGLTKGALLAKNTNIANKVKSIAEKVKNSDFANNMYTFRLNDQKQYMKNRESSFREINKTLQEAEELHFALKELPEQDRKNMYRYMTGDNTPISTEQKALIDNVRNKITDLGKKLVDDGQLEEKAFEEWKDVYVHRNYEKHLFKGLKENLSRAFNDTKTLQPVYKRGKTKTISSNDIHSAIEMMTEAGYFKKNEALNIKHIGQLEEIAKAIPISKGGVDFKRLPDGKVEIRRDWTKAEREKMGEVEDVAFAIPETISRLQELVTHSKFLKEVPSSVIGDTTKFTPDELKNSGFVQLNGVRYGALNGKFVQKDVAKDIGMMSRQLMGSDNRFERLYSEYLTMFKKSHTVYNPAAHINNISSNMTLQFMEGVNPPEMTKNIYDSIGVVKKVERVKELKAKTRLYEFPSDKKELDSLLNDKDIKLWYDAEANGLFGRSELNDILMRYANKGQDANKGISGLLKSLTGNKTSSTVEKIDRFASNLYQHEDNFNRFTLLRHFVNKKGMNLEDAINKVNTVIPDYTKPMATVPDFLRRTGITPFVAWTYYSTPILLRQLKERPARAMALMGLMYGSYATNGINPFDEKDMPQDGWAFKRVPLPFGLSSDGNKVTTLKVDRMIPHMELMNMVKPSDNMFVPQYIKDQLSGGIPQSLAGWMFNYNPYFGTKITYSKDTGDKAYHLAKHFTQNLLPTPDVLDNMYNLGESAILDKETRRTQKAVEPRTTTESFLKSIGINLMTYDKQRQRKKAIDDELKKVKEKRN